MHANKDSFGSDWCFISEALEGDLKSWINRERFPNYSKIDSYTLYAMGESGNLRRVRLVELGSFRV